MGPRQSGGTSSTAIDLIVEMVSVPIPSCPDSDSFTVLVGDSFSQTVGATDSGDLTIGVIGLLILLLSLMILLAAYQVVARNFFDTGILWGDALVRVLVLWVTFIGATIAARDDEHIRIDLLTRFISARSTDCRIHQVA